MTARRFAIGVVFAVIAALSLVGEASAQTDNCTALAAGATADITGPGGPCKRVTNGNSAVLCVMTGDAAHWTRFIAAVIPNVTIADCPASDCTAPWGTVYTNGTSNLAVSRWMSTAGCQPLTGNPTCAEIKGYVSCSSGVLTCTTTYYGVIACSSLTATTCTNSDCGGGGCQLC